MKIYDLHSHFLPGMDDGCKTVQEAVQVLESSYRQGVTAMFATPHYYPVETVDTFLQRRAEAYQLLCEQMGQKELPAICLGAEVAFRPGISYEEKLEQLCLGNSRYMLLELPFSQWSKEVLREVCNISSTWGITPILAHIERYIPIQSAVMLQQLLEMDVLVQMNAGYLLHFMDRRKGCRLLKAGTVQLLGSDCHNMTTRPQNINAALKYLEKRGMHSVVERVAQLSQHIFQAANEK